MHIRAKKFLGQHFLKDDGIALRITEALTHHGGYRHVIEIGPGTGALTKHLITRTDIDLTCIELDRESVPFLRDHYPALKLIEGDFLHLDLSRIANGKVAVIGNFPYNISTQIIFKVLENRDRVTEVVGMFQKEVADRFRAPHGNRTYGITSVLMQAFYTIEEVIAVPPSAFIPPPKVQSAVIRLQRNDVEKLPCDEGLFRAVVKAGFLHRRKTLHNALKTFAALPHGVPDQFAKLRAEQLSVADFITLAQMCTP